MPKKVSHSNPVKTNIVKKDRLLDMVAHDLRSPLTHANLHLDRLEALAKEEKLSPKVKKLIKETTFQVNRIASLVEKLNDLDGLDGHSEPLNCRPTNLVRWAKISYQNHLALAQNKEIHLEENFSDKEISILADPEALLRIFENLLSNALKFTPRGGKVSLSLSQAGKYGLVTVADTGPGIPAQEQKNLYRRFTRLSPKPTEGEPSLGLGLSIVKHLGEQMGGEIECSSKKGQGTAFTVRLPLA